MKKLFAKGLVALLPMAATIAVLYFVLGLLYTHVGEPLGNVLRWGLEQVTGLSQERLKQESWFYDKGAPVAGLAIGMVLVFFVGALVATFAGKKLYQFFERILSRMPVIGVIYPYARQFTDFFNPADRKFEFKNAVAVPFPTRGVYSVAFVTGEGMRHLNDAVKRTMVTVFVPTAPTPISGFVCWVPREDVIPLPITVDEALRLIISCGVLIPAHQSVSLAEFAAASDQKSQIADPKSQISKDGPGI